MLGVFYLGKVKRYYYYLTEVKKVALNFYFIFIVILQKFTLGG